MDGPLAGPTSSNPHASDPPDVFLSYAREDLTFAVALRDLLDAAGLRLWLDVDGLFGGEEYWPELCNAMDAAAVIVFVMTPGSVTSPFCRRELVRAIEMKKRVVPVCREDIDPQQLLPEIAATQWIFFREEDDTVAARAALLGAIRADWERDRARARVLVRARQWERHERNRAWTLRGRELANAKALFTTDVGTEVRPIGLEETFIAASEVAATTRRRIWWSASTGSICAIVVLGWFAVTRQIESLANTAQGDLSSGYAAATVERLERADRLCAYIKFGGERCVAVALNLGAAYVDTQRYGDAILQFSRVVDPAPVKILNPARLEIVLSALQSRAFARIMMAETLSDAEERSGEYDRADQDLTEIVTRSEHLPSDTPVRPVWLTEARISIGRADYPKARAQLARAATLRPLPVDIDLLVSIVERCLGNAYDGREAFKRYIESLPQQNLDPDWLRNRAYYQRGIERCLKAL